MSEIKSYKNVGDIIGGYGLWQINLFFFDFVLQLLATMNALAGSFMAPKINYWCNQTDEVSSPMKNLTHHESLNATANCNMWIYDDSIFKSTLISEWDLVGNRAWLASFSSSLYMIGYFVSSLLSGHLSDKFGRRIVLKVAIIVEILAGISCAASYTMTQFLISRFISAIACYAKFLTGFTLLMECVASEHRTTYGVLSRSGRAFGHMLLPLVAWLMPHFRYIQLTITLPGILLLLWLLIISESPRWLLVHNETEKVEKLVVKALNMNNTKIDDLKSKLEQIKKNLRTVEVKQRKENFFDLWKTKNLRKNTMIMSTNWFVTVFIYYALSFNVQDLGGNLFLNFVISGAVELPSIALCCYVMKKLSRKFFLSVSMCGIFLAFVSCAVVSYFDFKDAITTRVVLAMFGKFCATCAFAINYIMSSEMYPTVVRQIGIGTNSAAGRIGSMLSPFMKEVNSKFHASVSFGIFATISLIDAIMVSFLPETKGKDIPDTIDEVENTKSQNGDQLR